MDARRINLHLSGTDLALVPADAGAEHVKSVLRQYAGVDIEAARSCADWLAGYVAAQSDGVAKARAAALVAALRRAT